jgi:predicted DNA-binding transcriptional regulator AlpA
MKRTLLQRTDAQWAHDQIQSLAADKHLAPYKALVSASLERLFAIERKIEALIQAAAVTDDRALPLPEVLQILGIKKSFFYELQNPKSPHYDANCPTPLKYGNSPRSGSFWLRSKVLAYLMCRSNLGAAA